MSPLVAAVSHILSFLTVAGDTLIILLFVTFLVRKLNGDPGWLNFIGDKGIAAAFAIAFLATGSSLFYSEIAGLVPCELCWFQRIFMYPQVIMLGIALWKKDRRIADYSIALSVIGATIAAYHYLLQIGIAPFALPCSAVGYSVSCSKVFVNDFGYVTIPMMALTAFLLIIEFAAAVKSQNLGKSGEVSGR